MALSTKCVRRVRLFCFLKFGMKNELFSSKESCVYSEEQLKQLLTEFRGLPCETEWIEFKQARATFDTDDLGRYVSALSNEANLKKKPCAWLIFGIEDRPPRNVVGTNFRSGKASLDKLKHEIAEHANGLTFLEIFELHLPEGRVLMFQIPATPAGILASWKGHFYGRNGESLVPLSLHKLEFIRSQPGSGRDEARLLEKPDLALRFVYPEFPALVLINQSSVLARDVKWTVVLWNRDLPQRNDPLPIPVSTFDWIRPNDEGGPQSLFGSPAVQSLLKLGDRLFGSASVCSPNCIQGRTYVVYIVWGKSGWFAEIKGEEAGKILIPRNFLKSSRDLYFQALDSMVPISNRINIGKS
jgi:hypothetical protein